MTWAAGCAAGPASPADLAGYAVYASDHKAAGDVRWAEYLAAHLGRRARGGMPVVYEGSSEGRFRIGVAIDTASAHDFRIVRNRDGVELSARSGEAMRWLQYQLMKRLAQEDARIEATDLPAATVGLRDTSGRFAFVFRGIYTPAVLDADYAGIVAAHDVERSWALWGHALGRAVGADAPTEVLATVDGKRYDGQYCLSSEALFKRLESYIEAEVGSGADGRQRLMIAPNDDEAVCTCAACAAAGNTPQNGTPAAAKLVARLAERFPGHTFFLLGYRSTREAPAARMPANAGAVVSAIDLPLRCGAASTEAGRKFLARLAGWQRATDSVFVWDYIADFDDYLTPYPVLEPMRERLRLYRDRGIQGVFLNGSGYDYSTLDDMRSRVLAALLLDPNQSPDRLMHDFFTDRYPVCGELLYAFCRSIERRACDRKKTLPRYGGIRDAERAWLDAAEFVRFYDALRQTLPGACGEERARIEALVAALSYTRLEIARHHAADAAGCAERQGERLRIRPETEAWLAALATFETHPSMQHIGESGFPIGEYIAQWRRRVRATENLLTGIPARAVGGTDEDYTDLSCLTDGIAGLPGSYHYGWHIRTGDLEVELPVQRLDGNVLFRMTFLDDPRHRIRAPRRVELWADDRKIGTLTPVADDSGRLFTAEGRIRLDGARTLRIRALRPEGGRTKLAADEILITKRL